MEFWLGVACIVSPWGGGNVDDAKDADIVAGEGATTPGTRLVPGSQEEPCRAGPQEAVQSIDNTPTEEDVRPVLNEQPGLNVAEEAVQTIDNTPTKEDVRPVLNEQLGAEAGDDGWQVCCRRRGQLRNAEELFKPVTLPGDPPPPRQRWEAIDPDVESGEAEVAHDAESSGGESSSEEEDWGESTDAAAPMVQCRSAGQSPSPVDAEAAMQVQVAQNDASVTQLHAEDAGNRAHDSEAAHTRPTTDPQQLEPVNLDGGEAPPPAAADEPGLKPGMITVIATRLNGEALRVQLPREETVGTLLQTLSPLSGLLNWQQRLISPTGEMLEESGRLLHNLLPSPEDTTIHVTLLVTRGIPAHVSENTRSVFMGLKDESYRYVVDLLRRGDVDVSKTSQSKSASKGKRRGGSSMLQVAMECLGRITHRPGREYAKEIVSEMLRLGADPNVADQEGTRPLHAACAHGHGSAAALLLEHGADPIAIGPGKATPLHLAMGFFFVKAARHVTAQEREALGNVCCRLITAKADLQAKDGQGYTAFGMARDSLRAGLQRLAAERPSGCVLVYKVGRDQALAKSPVPACVIEAMAPDVWEGWPQAFQRML